MVRNCLIATFGLGVVAACASGDGLVDGAGTIAAARTSAPATTTLSGAAAGAVSAAPTIDDTRLPPAPAQIHTRPQIHPPPRSGPGCYAHTSNGWQSTSCEENGTVEANFGRPVAYAQGLSALLSESGGTATPLVFGQLSVHFAQVGAEANVPSQGFDAAAGTPNQWSIQSNTNNFAGNNGDQDWVQFTLQTSGSGIAACIWNVDTTTGSYPRACAPTIPQRPGGLLPGDLAIITGYVDPATQQLEMNVWISWVAPGESNEYSVSTTDTNGLTGKWTDIGGTVFGLGNASTAAFTNAEVWSTVIASTCPQEEGSQPPCATSRPPQTLRGENSLTAERNNLYLVAPAVPVSGADFIEENGNFTLSTSVATTSGSCLTADCFTQAALANEYVACQGASDAYGISANQTWGFAPPEVQTWWQTNQCTTAPESSTDLCQKASEVYGIVAGKTWGYAPPSVKAWWQSNNCNTSPLTSDSLCQRASDTYGIVANQAWGSAPGYVQSWWTASGCATAPRPDTACQMASELYGISSHGAGAAPTSVQTWWNDNSCNTAPINPDLCQNASDRYGIAAGKTWGFAPSEIQSWWTATGCATAPLSPDSCQRASEVYGIEANLTWGFAPAAVQTWWTDNNCGAVPLFSEDPCQRASDIYGIAADTTWAFAPSDVQSWWEAQNCGSSPAPTTKNFQ